MGECWDRNHVWELLYLMADVERCTSCGVSRRWARDHYQYMPTKVSPWAPGEPACKPEGTDV